MRRRRPFQGPHLASAISLNLNAWYLQNSPGWRDQIDAAVANKGLGIIATGAFRMEAGWLFPASKRASEKTAMIEKQRTGEQTDHDITGSSICPNGKGDSLVPIAMHPK